MGRGTNSVVSVRVRVRVRVLEIVINQCPYRFFEHAHAHDYDVAFSSFASPRDGHVHAAEGKMMSTARNRKLHSAEISAHDTRIDRVRTGVGTPDEHAEAGGSALGGDAGDVGTPRDQLGAHPDDACEQE